MSLQKYPHITNLVDEFGMYQLVQSYLSYMSVKNYAVLTRKNREAYLYFFLEWAGLRGLNRPTEITKPILESYQHSLYVYRKKDGNPLTFNTQHNRLVAVRAWFKWLTRSNYLLFNPASDLELPKLEKRLPKAILTASEVEKIMSQVSSDKLGLRDRAILEVLYSTGIRRFECINLKLQDIDSERGTILIRQGKGARDRMLPIGERAIESVDKYLNELRGDLACRRDNGEVFLSRLGDKMGCNGMSSMVRNYIDKANIGKRGSCHLFRHTMATLMLENGADIRFIQAMLGHVKLDTTQVYTQVSIKKLKEVHTLTHPADIKSNDNNEINQPQSSQEQQVEATEESLFSMLNIEEKSEKYIK